MFVCHDTKIPRILSQLAKKIAEAFFRSHAEAVILSHLRVSICVIFKCKPFTPLRLGLHLHESAYTAIILQPLCASSQNVTFDFRDNLLRTSSWKSGSPGAQLITQWPAAI